MKTAYTISQISLLLLLLLVLPLRITAQSVQSSYFLESVPARLSINPAFRPQQGYVGFPGVANLYVDSKTNSLSLDRFIFPQKEAKSVTFMHPGISVDQFMSGISANNYLDLDASASILSVGWWYKNRSFWSVDVSLKSHADITLPEELFRLAKVGLKSDLTTPIRYDINNLQVIANAYAEIGLGYSRSFLSEQLVVGIKAKALLGVGDAYGHIEELSLLAGENEWIAQSKASLRVTFPGVYPKFTDEGKFDGIDIDDDESFSLPGKGFGFDVGAVYTVDRLSLSAALTDVGFISWSEKYHLSMQTPTTKVRIPGDDLFNLDGDNSLEDHFDDILDDLEDVLNFQEVAQSGRKTSLRTRFNAGVEYALLADKKISLGLASSTFFNTSHTGTELTASANFRPSNWLQGAFSYSFLHSQFKTFGFALHLAPKFGLNLFLASDYILYHRNADWLPTSSKGVNFQLGMVVPLGKRR